LSYTQGGSPVCQLSVATTRAYTNKANDRVEETEWRRIVVWGKSAEHCNNYLAKGRQVYVEGRIQTRSYDDKDGVKRYSTEIVADTVQFLGGRESSTGNNPPSQFNTPSGSPNTANAGPSLGSDDDIPF